MRRASWFLVTLLFTALCASAQANRTEELMRKSGLWEQAAQMRIQMKAGIAEARKQAMAAKQELLTDAEFTRLQAAVDRAFAPDVLRETMTLNMEELVQPADQDAVLNWLSSDLGVRFTRWEVQAGAVEEIRKAETEAPKILKSLTPVRLDKYRRLAVALDAGNTIATLTVNLTTAIVYGLALMVPDTDADAAAIGMRKRLESKRADAVKFFSERSLQTYSYVYRNATDAQMEEYVRFAESAPARRYHDAGIKAIDNTISQAALALGQELRKK